MVRSGVGRRYVVADGRPEQVLLPVGDKPVIRHTVERVIAAGPQEVVVVTGYQGRDVGRAVFDSR